MCPAECVTTINGGEVLAIILACGLALRFWRETRRQRLTIAMLRTVHDDAEAAARAATEALERAIEREEAAETARGAS